MKAVLAKIKVELYYYEKGQRKEGVPSGLSGDVSPFLRGDVSGLRGDVSGLRGDVSGLSGDVSGLSGDVSGLSGDVDDAGITEDERNKGIRVNDLVKGD